MSHGELNSETADSDPYRTQAIVSLTTETRKPKYRIVKHRNTDSSYKRNEFRFTVQKRFWIFWCWDNVFYSDREALTYVRNMLKDERAEQLEKENARQVKQLAKQLKSEIIWDDTKE